MRGRKYFDPKSLLRGVSEITRCNRTYADADYLRHALPISENETKHPLRIMCLYLASYPAEKTRMELVGQTFAAHCSSAVFFVAAARELEHRKIWRMASQHGGHRVVNLAQVYPASILSPDDQPFMRVEAIDETSRKLLSLHANLITKTLLMFVMAHEQFLDEADVFCRVDLDSAFIVENFRGFTTAVKLHPQDRVYIGLQTYWLKYRFGVYANGGAGICLTHGSVRALVDSLRSAGVLARRLQHVQPGRCELQNGFNDDVPLAQCLRLANVSAHPALEDELGRAYASRGPLPCRQHLSSSSMQAEPTLPNTESRLEQLRRMLGHDLAVPGGSSVAISASSSWLPQLHRYVVCEPQELLMPPGQDYWISPFAFGFHGYKDLREQQEAYDIIYQRKTCDWQFGYKLKVLRPT